MEFDVEEVTETHVPMGKTYLYDFKKGEFILRNGKQVEVFGKDALRVWIEKVLRTEYGRFCIYKGEEYGVVLEDLIGSNHPQSFVEAEIKREVGIALLRHQDIDAIEKWAFVREGKWMRVQFEVITRDGAFDMEVEI
ncbi:DUF2634 domain-containing protein [Streptococcus mutans]|nr:DUF2634 domain-containing protein [Streptococcus mutans]MCB5100742.1 DUF2634 domain-containing protein [Streptococcus mutans]